METAEVGSWLLNQAPVVTVLGIVIWWLAKKFEDAIIKKDALADTVVKITLLWEERYSKESADDKDIKEFMKEIRELMHEIKYGK